MSNIFVPWALAEFLKSSCQKVKRELTGLSRRVKQLFKGVNFSDLSFAVMSLKMTETPITRIM